MLVVVLISWTLPYKGMGFHVAIVLLTLLVYLSRLQFCNLPCQTSAHLLLTLNCLSAIHLLIFTVNYATLSLKLQTVDTSLDYFVGRHGQNLFPHGHIDSIGLTQFLTLKLPKCFP